MSSHVPDAVPYVRPPLVVRRLFNPVAMRLGISGTETLSVRGRRSGEIRRVPVIPVDYADERYLVSPRGETQWARNLRVAGEAELEFRRRGARRFRATEVPVAERAPVIAAYRRVAGRAVASFFRDMPDPADHPVFRLEPPEG
jgi:deazaflavin-dependent oxidoreductase (nitroreductase family)